MPRWLLDVFPFLMGQSSIFGTLFFQSSTMLKLAFCFFLIDWQSVGEMCVVMLIGVFIDSYIIFFQKEFESFKLFKLT